MGKIILLKEELRANPYVEKVSAKAHTFPPSDFTGFFGTMS